MANDEIKIKIIAFDFDQCISAKHTIAEKIDVNNVNQMSNQEINEMASPLFRDSKFRELLRYFHSLKTHRYVVTSYGSRYTIVAFLTRLGLVDLFDYILTPASFNLEDGFDQTQILDGKNVMLDAIKKQYSLCDQNQLILMDDSLNNILFAQRANNWAIQCNPTGATLIDLNKLQAYGFLKML